MIKRLFDIVVSTVLILLTWPLMLAAALVVRRSSPGPILFRQKRVGKDGVPFHILKFRTMTVSSGAEITVQGDKRITRGGAFLRQWKLDELPQAFNVLAGDMSIVGPRPEVPYYVQFYPPELKAVVLAVRPGITDLASIKFRNESDLLANRDDPERYYREVIMPEKLQLAAEYVRRQSLLMDLRIILATAFRVARPL